MKVNNNKVFRYMALMFIITSLLTGCSQEKVLELEKQELRAKVKELELLIDETSAKVEHYEKTYDLRNVLDIKSRQIISSLNLGVFNEEEKALLGDNILIQEDGLLIRVANNHYEMPFFSNSLDFEKLRQRYFLLDEEERFITGYEVFSVSDNMENDVMRSVLIFTYIETPSGWKLVDINADR
ncbi:hypothetical protein EDC18_101503 [Natranaerovirga pectinivora]|uniref:Uncharacterized protein n=1 Tax=Natranaerovirga pectinivora TaxID=682400 RepID=A0A4R3MPI7_9FIRM|nr:hypothetical protein [Natranaerovirga pectinivora]TCT17205.1 hypothetical protein EDC18_101503 [Natranaerovirga pectinivora]